MSTIKVRKMDLNRIGLKTSRLLYNELPSVRAMVHSWFDGNPADLLNRNQQQFLRRLVVRSLKNMSAWKLADLSYGGTSNDEQDVDATSGAYEMLRMAAMPTELPPTRPISCKDGFDSREGVKFVHIRWEHSLCLCNRCECEVEVPEVVRSTTTDHFAILCGCCAESVNVL
jgi:hypothetical protein